MSPSNLLMYQTRSHDEIDHLIIKRDRYRRRDPHRNRNHLANGELIISFRITSTMATSKAWPWSSNTSIRGAHRSSTTTTTTTTSSYWQPLSFRPLHPSHCGWLQSIVISCQACAVERAVYLVLGDTEVLLCSSGLRSSRWTRWWVFRFDLDLKLS